MDIDKIFEMLEIKENDFYIIPLKAIILVGIIFPMVLSFLGIFVGGFSCLILLMTPFGILGFIYDMLKESLPCLSSVLKKIKRFFKKNIVIQEIQIEDIEIAEVAYIMKPQKELNNYKCYKYPRAQIVVGYYVEPL